jgi:hypothetical protein
MSRSGRLPRRHRDPRHGPDAVALFDPNQTSAVEAARAAARAHGCTCDPEVAIDGVRAVLAHDHWCALLRQEDVN